MIHKSNLENVKFEDVDWDDYPDFCDAYISYAEMDGRELTEQELEEVNDDRDLVYELLSDDMF